MSQFFEITVRADTNDADYVELSSKISAGDLSKLQPLISAIKNFTPYTVTVGGLNWAHAHNYPTGEYSPRTDLGEKFPHEIYPQVPKEIHDMFIEFCPADERGFHTIVGIWITPFVSKTRLL